MLKLKLTADEVAKLPDAIKSEYKPSGSEFVLDTDVVYEDVTPLKNALTEEKKHRKAATEKVTTLEAEKATLEARAGTASDVEKSYVQKLADAETKAKEREGVLKGQLHTILVDNTAIQLAAEVSTAPDLLLPHIRSRIVMEEQDGKMIPRILDRNGKASALNVNDLKAEIVADEKFAPIIAGSKASGGGAHGGKDSPAGGKTLAEMSEAEMVKLYKENPAKFDQLQAAQQGAAT